MPKKKELRIGLIGYGFMGRTHTNAYKRVNDFFPELKHRPVLKAVCARNKARLKAFAEQWGGGIDVVRAQVLEHEGIDNKLFDLIFQSGPLPSHGSVIRFQPFGIICFQVPGQLAHRQITKQLNSFQI